MRALHLMLCLVLAVAAPRMLKADMEDMSDVKTTDHAELSFGDGYLLAMNMSPDHATVGHMVILKGDLTRNGQGVEEVRVELAFHHIEDDVDNYRTAFVAPHGGFTLQHHFFDGAPHKVVLKVSPLAAGTWPAQELTMDINVVAVQPPTAVVMRTLLMLVAVAGAAMVAGYLLSGSRRR